MNRSGVGQGFRGRVLAMVVITGLVATAAPGLGEMSHVIVTPEAPTEEDPLPPGHYVLTVTEHHASLSDPLPNIAVVEFDVLPLSPTRELSWGRIRALYR